MEILDSVNGKEPGPSAEQPVAPVRVPIDRVELKRQWVRQAEEEQVEEALNLYAKAAMQWMQSGEPEDPEEPPESEEEREAKSQQLKLQQKCQDIAALMLAEELEELLDVEE